MPAAPRPFFSSNPPSRDAGGICTRVAVGPSGPAATSQFSSVGSVLHDAAPGQEAGCNLSMNGKSGNTNNRLLRRNGSNYPGSLLSVHSVSPLCTRPVVSSVTARPGRPNSAINRIRPPVTTQVRSGREEPSVAASSHTVSESMSATVEEKSAPPSVDHPKLLSTPFQYTSARELQEKELRTVSEFGVTLVMVHLVPLARDKPCQRQLEMCLLEKMKGGILQHDNACVFQLNQNRVE